MSRNKTIEQYHRITGLPYSVCRAKLKACHWDLCEALGITEALNAVWEKTNALADSLTDVLAGAFEIVGNTCLSIAENLRGLDNVE